MPKNLPRIATAMSQARFGAYTKGPSHDRVPTSKEKAAQIEWRKRLQILLDAK